MVDVTLPSNVESKKQHQNDDSDGDKTSHHHTLGASRSQASPGDHSHDGGSSKELLGGITITGAKAGNAALASVVSALVKLGATDSTT